MGQVLTLKVELYLFLCLTTVEETQGVGLDALQNATAQSLHLNVYSSDRQVDEGLTSGDQTTASVEGSRGSRSIVSQTPVADVITVHTQRLIAYASGFRQALPTLRISYAISISTAAAAVLGITLPFAQRCGLVYPGSFSSSFSSSIASSGPARAMPSSAPRL